MFDQLKEYCPQVFPFSGAELGLFDATFIPKSGNHTPGIRYSEWQRSTGEKST